jgi:hypothetical protein
MCIASFRTSWPNREAFFATSLIARFALTSQFPPQDLDSERGFSELRKCPDRLAPPSHRKPPRGYTEATLRLPWGYPGATLRLPQSHPVTKVEGRIKNAEWPGKAAQSQVHASYKPCD